MIDIKLSPPREGTRGGREQFKWEDLKSHDLKDREHYLGHSVKVGLLERKNKFYKHDWYLKKESPDHTDDQSNDEKLNEQELTRRYEDEIMKEMLGLKPRRLMLLKSRPTDLKQLAQLLSIDKETKSSEDPKSLRASKHVPKSRSVSGEKSSSRYSYEKSYDQRSKSEDSYSSRSVSKDYNRRDRGISRSSSYDNRYSKNKYKIKKTRDRSSKKRIHRDDKYSSKRSSRRSRSRSPKRRSSRSPDKYRNKHESTHESKKYYGKKSSYRERDGNRRRSR